MQDKVVDEDGERKGKEDKEVAEMIANGICWNINGK